MLNHILFHRFKHHLGFIKAWMDINKGNLSIETVQTIKTLGSSQLDMYCGNLTVDEILQQVSSFLLQQGITENGQYRQWVGSGYKLCTLADGSVFTLRHIDHIKPVHIHPARHVPYTMRIKANALKSVVCYRLVFGSDEKLNIANLNRVRKEYLGLSPVLEGTALHELEKVANLLAIR